MSGSTIWKGWTSWFGGVGAHVAGRGPAGGEQPLEVRRRPTARGVESEQAAHGGAEIHEYADPARGLGQAQRARERVQRGGRGAERLVRQRLEGEQLDDAEGRVRRLVLREEGGGLRRRLARRRLGPAG